MAPISISMYRSDHPWACKLPVPWTVLQDNGWGRVVMQANEEQLIFFFFTGPDICGFDIKKVHVILHFKNQYHSNKKPIRCKVNGSVCKSVIVLTLVRS